ncbi:MAG: glycosyltransferase family 2 protein [Spirochaetota bacterium]
MKKNSVSVIIPAYNAEKTIRSALVSVLGQSLPPLEVIVIDDGSCDGTAACVRKLRRTHKNIILLTQENAGPAAARNWGIRESKGAYIAFCDADDTWKADKLKLQCSWLDAHPGVGMIGARTFPPERAGEVHRVSFIHLLFKNEFVTSTVVMRRGAALSHGFSHSQRYSEDYRLWLQVVHDHGGAVYEEQLAVYGGGKPGFGHSGLSAKLLQMEKGELSNYCFLLRRGYLPGGIFLFFCACVWSIMKFLRRAVLCALRRKNER